MNTTATLSRVIPLHRPLWKRWLDDVSARLQARRAQRQARRRAALQRCLAAFRCWDTRQVAALDDHLLRDIGVPDWLRDEAAAHRRDASMAAVWQGAGPAEGFDPGTRW